MQRRTFLAAPGRGYDTLVLFLLDVDSQLMHLDYRLVHRPMARRSA